jgi:UDP:flavonoid glycosyltransferase YjiC (YdhE family)
MADGPAMRVLICTTGGLGHLLPLLPLATALRDLGHHVGWVTAPDALPMLREDGFDLWAAGPTFEDSRRRFRATYVDAAGLAGEPLSTYTFPRLFGAVLAPAMLDGIERAIGDWRPDFLVHEPAALAAPLACAQVGLRHVTQGYGLQLPREHLQHAMSFFGAHWQARGLAVPVDAGLYRHLYLDIAPASLASASDPIDNAYRFNACRRVDVPRPSLPAPLQAALQGAAAARPRIYVTFGTVFNRSPALITAAAAAARLGGTVVVTAGADGDLRPLAELGPHVHAHRFLDQGAVLTHCDAVVSHGGAGTLLGAASHGLPHLVLPQAADHFRNASALARVSAGRAVEPPAQTLESVTSSLSAVLQSEPLRAGAKAIAQEIAALPDAGAAVGMLERWHARAAADFGSNDRDRCR